MSLVAEASNGREAIQQYRAHHPDVTLMDLQMPEMNGLDALIAIRGEFPDARIIVLTTYAGDVQVLEMFRNTGSTYTGGVDVKLAKRTTLSYDQFFGFYKGDSGFQLAPTPFTLSNGTPVSLGVDVLTGPTVTCGSGANKTENVINGVANPYCSGTIVASSTSPIRTSFPTEQLRFSSHYWDKVSFNGRLLYSGDTYNVNNFNQTFNGLNTRTSIRQEVETGGLANGRLASNKRANSVGDFGFVADLNKYVSVSDSFVFRNLRTSGYSIMAALSARVSPVRVSRSLATAPMSPACSSVRGGIVFPKIEPMWARRSSTPEREFTRCPSFLSTPEITLK